MLYVLKEYTYFLISVQFKTLRVEEYRLSLKNLEQHYQTFMRDSQDSQIFGADDRLQAENNYGKATQHFDNLLRSVEQGGCQLTADCLFRCIEILHLHFCCSFAFMTAPVKLWFALSSHSSHYDIETYFSEPVLNPKDKAMGKHNSVDLKINRL